MSRVHAFFSWIAWKLISPLNLFLSKIGAGKFKEIEIESIFDMSVENRKGISQRSDLIPVWI